MSVLCGSMCGSMWLHPNKATLVQAVTRQASVICVDTLQKRLSMPDLADCQQSSLSVMALGVEMQSVDGMEGAFKAEWISGQVGLAIWSSITIDQ